LFRFTTGDLLRRGALALILLSLLVIPIGVLIYSSRTHIERRESAGGSERYWPTTCLRINGVEALLYVADTPEKQAEGYMYKNSTDFMGLGAVGMLFKLSIPSNYTVIFTMRNVAFPLYLLHIVPGELGDIAMDIIYMEPWKDYGVVVRTNTDYFIELNTTFYKHLEEISRSRGEALIRVSGTC